MRHRGRGPSCATKRGDKTGQIESAKPYFELHHEEDAMFRTGLLCSAALIASLALGAPAQAQDFNGSLEGLVKSASWQALTGAYIKFTNAEIRLTFMAVTQAQGRYTMNKLPPGNYTVQAIGNGFQSKLTPVNLTAGKPANADVSLTDKQGAVIPNGWIRRPGRVAGNELDMELAPPVLPEGEGKAIVEAKCGQCHFLHRLTQMRWTKANWVEKIKWMRERIHERGANDLTEQEQKTVIDYLAKNFSNTTPRIDPNGRLSRTPLKGVEAKYIAVDFEGPNPDAAWHDVAVDHRGVAWVNQLNVYALGKFDPKTFTFSEVKPPEIGVKPGTLAHMGPPARGQGDSIWMADIGGTRRWLEFNTKTERFNSYLVPADFKGPISGNFMRPDPNGKNVWTTAGTRIIGLDLNTKQFSAWDIPTKNPGAYGMDVAGD